MKGTVLFITGIDTNIGKTFATGMIACALAGKGKKVITQKMIQTGCCRSFGRHRNAPENTGNPFHRRG